MANRQTYVVGALGVLLGMVVGANSAQRADTVAFSGASPNYSATQQYRPTAVEYMRRSRSDLGEYTVPSTDASFGEGVIGNVRANRVMESAHGAAPDIATIRGMPVRLRKVYICDEFGITTSRYANCVGAYLSDEEFEG